MPYPPLFLKKNEDKRLRHGHLWIFSNEIDCLRSPLENFAPGDLVTICDHTGKTLGIAYLNPNTLIAARILSRKTNIKIGVSFFKERFAQALALRERLFSRPFYRLVFAESDGLPGLIIDRFGSVYSVQISTAGMEKLKNIILEALLALLAPSAILLKNDSAQRQIEDLTLELELAHGVLPETLTAEENGAHFKIDILNGQKTGWFYDHRANRKAFAEIAKGLNILDLFSYSGAWGIPAAMAGANQVICVDSSESALALAKENAKLNRVNHCMEFERADVFEFLKELRDQNLHFDAIILDPPALIKRRKDFKAGYEAYRRLNHLALQVLSNQGILVSASCSHHLSRDNLHEILRSAGRHIDRHLVFYKIGGQDSDHPVHPALSETDYLKSFFCAVSNRF
jgi:23S rRNA (cytosine1962-C5)-methyltransferase